MNYLRTVLEIGVLVTRHKLILLRHALSKRRIRFRRYFRYDSRIYTLLSTQDELEFDTLFLKLTPEEKRRLISAKGAGFQALETMYKEKYMRHSTDE